MNTKKQRRMSRTLEDHPRKLPVKANDLNVYRYLEHILTEPPKFADEKGCIDPARLDDLLPWSNKLPAQCHKPRR